MNEIKIKNYYVIFKSKDTGWYETERRIISIVADEDIAKDFCAKFKAYYETLTVGDDNIPSSLKNCK